MIGLIGYGRFGRLTVTHLARDFPVLVHTRDVGKAPDIRSAGGRPATLAAVCGQEVVILSVPISAMCDTLVEIAPLLSSQALVIDVCSVKEQPVRWMRKLLPPSVSILATHPMFGPDSASESLHGQKIVLCPERIDSRRLQTIAKWLKCKGLVVIETTASDHDRQIAVTLALTHFIGRSLAEFGAGNMDIDTEGYKRLRHILEVVNNDTWQLFEDMHRYNAYAAETRDKFMAAMAHIGGRLPPSGA